MKLLLDLILRKRSTKSDRTKEATMDPLIRIAAKISGSNVYDGLYVEEGLELSQREIDSINNEISSVVGGLYEDSERILLKHGIYAEGNNTSCDLFQLFRDDNGDQYPNPFPYKNVILKRDKDTYKWLIKRGTPFVRHLPNYKPQVHKKKPSEGKLPKASVPTQLKLI